MTTRTFIRLVVFAIGVGLALGLLIPSVVIRNADAVTIFVRLGVHPGATSTLSCGWHGTCYDPPAAGSALDWSNSGGSNVVWRSYGYRSDASPNKIGTGKILVTTGTCYEVSAEVTDAFGCGKGRIRYTHSQTWTPDWTFDINGGGGTWGQWTAVTIGFTSNPETSACAFDPPRPPQPLWTGPHLHQAPGTGSWTVNTPCYHTPPCYQGAGCTPTPGNDGAGTVYSYYVTGGYEQYRQQWWWSY